MYFLWHFLKKQQYDEDTKYLNILDMLCDI